MNHNLNSVTLKDKVASLPDKPGVYIMQDSEYKVIYVGKAKALKNRVRSYFSNGAHDVKTKALVSQIQNFNYIVTSNELEALILECNLIKKYAPKYNVLLKDGKSYPYLKITLHETYPRVYLRRHLEDDKSMYFGPFADVHALNTTLTLLEKVFKLRTCKKMQNKRPCMRYYIKECLAPCQGYIDAASYRKMIDSVILFLNGKSSKLINELKSKVDQSSRELRFEDAILYRSQIEAIEKIQQDQIVVNGTVDNVDIIGMAEGDNLSCVQVLGVREGKLSDQKYFYLQHMPEDDQNDRLSNFVKQYYTQTTFVPNEIFLPKGTDDTDLLTTFLCDHHNKVVKFSIPQRGKKLELLKMAEENANIKLYEALSSDVQNERKKAEALDELASVLSISGSIGRIECFDISHNQGCQTVASMVVFIDGLPAKNRYKRYKLEITEGKADDFMSMKEVLGRRYRNGEDIPDLIVIDGGKGQLSSAVEELTSLGLYGHVPIISLAKQFEHVFVPGSSRPIVLERSSPALHILQNIRNEAHRFAINYHRRLREKRGAKSVLEHIESIGEAKRIVLLDHFKSIAAIKRATIPELVAVHGVGENSARAIYDFFRRD